MARSGQNQQLTPRWRRRTIAATIAAALLAGCGSSKTDSQTTASAPAQATTPASGQTTSTQTPPTQTQGASSAKTTTAPAQEETAPSQEKVEISSPVVREEGVLPSRYTCDGQNAPLPLRWHGIPSGTKELMFDVLGLQPVKGELFFNWAVTGLSPDSKGVGPGPLPAGAVTGTNSLGHAGYTICPPKGKAEKYVAVLFAVDRKLSAKNGFDAMALRREALHNSKYEGFLVFSYKRRG